MVGGVEPVCFAFRAFVPGETQVALVYRPPLGHPGRRPSRDEVQAILAPWG